MRITRLNVTGSTLNVNTAGGVGFAAGTRAGTMPGTYLELAGSSPPCIKISVKSTPIAVSLEHGV